MSHSATYYCPQQIPGVVSLGYTQVRNRIRSVYQSIPSLYQDLCTQHATLKGPATHARNVLHQEVLFAMYFRAEDKLEYKKILFNLLGDLNFFLLLAQRRNMHRHN